MKVREKNLEITQVPLELDKRKQFTRITATVFPVEKCPPPSCLRYPAWIAPGSEHSTGIIGRLQFSD